jgi:hypothetical protein
MASSLEYDDFFAVLDMLGEDGMDLGDDLPDEPSAKMPKTAAAVIRKHPVGCRQRNVVRRMVCASLEREDCGDPFLSQSRAVLKEMLEKDQAQRERERLEYLKSAR